MAETPETIELEFDVVIRGTYKASVEVGVTAASVARMHEDLLFKGEFSPVLKDTDVRVKPV